MNTFTNIETQEAEESGLFRDLKRLQEGGVSRLLVCALVLWMLYLVSAFRLPTTAITISDANASAAVRQLLFASTGMIAGVQLLVSRSLGTILVLRWHYTGLAILMILSFAWSDLPVQTIKRTIIFICGLLSLITIVHSSRNPVRLMLVIVVGFTASVSALSLLFSVILPSDCTVNPARAGLSGISNHPNTLAPFLSIGLVLSFGLTAFNNRQKLLLRIAQCVLAIGLLLTFSITTFITTLVAYALYLFFSSTGYRRGAYQLVTVFVVAFILLVGVKTLKSSFFNATGRDESLSGRDVLWQVCFYEAKKKILMGHGFGAFWTEGKGRELVQTWNPRQSHHSYLDTILDLGILGLLVTVYVFPIRMLFSWSVVSGNPGSPARRAFSAMMAVSFAYLGVYGLGQSILLRLDSFPFFVLVWVVLLFTHTDTRGMVSEFSGGSSGPSSPVSKLENHINL